MKLKTVLAAMTLAAAPALAQTAVGPQPDPVKLEFSRANLSLIAAGIMKLPYDQALPLLTDLQKQLDAQAPKAAPVAEKPKAAKN